MTERFSSLAGAITNTKSKTEKAIKAVRDGHLYNNSHK